MSYDSVALPALAAPASRPSDLSRISTDSTPAISPAEEISDAMSATSNRLTRPKLGSRKSSGSMIISRDQGDVVVDEHLDDGDVRSMSPRRNSSEVQKLTDDARRELIEQAKVLQTSLQAIVERVESVREEHEKLEGGNKFLQSYIGELMQTSKITTAAPMKTKKGRAAK